MSHARRVLVHNHRFDDRILSAMRDQDGLADFREEIVVVE
jgi:hypothetical protein